MTGKTCQDVKNGYKWHWRRGQAACDKCMLQERTRQRSIAKTKKFYRELDYLFQLTVGRGVDDPTKPEIKRWNCRDSRRSHLELEWSKMTEFEKQHELFIPRWFWSREWDKENQQWIYHHQEKLEHVLKMKQILTELFNG